VRKHPFAEGDILDIIQIKCILAVLETGNFSEAGEQLHMSQSSVSKKILALETELGFKLIDRSGKTCALSSVGNAIVGHFIRIIDNFDQIEETLETFNNGDNAKNHLKIIGIPPMHRYNIVRMASEFVHLHSDVHLSIEEMGTDKVFLMLKKLDFDLAFCSDSNLNAKYYNFQTVATECFMAAVHKDNAFADQETVELAQLKDMLFILNKPSTWPYIQCMEACQKVGFTPSIIHTTSRPNIALEFVHGNPNSVYLAFRQTILQESSPLHKSLHIVDSPEFRFVFAWRKDRLLSETAKAFLEYARCRDFTC
jgi:DNA-binding transcriptional LysR family regulator